MCCNALDESAFHQMEAYILSTLQYTLGRPSHGTWLKIYLAGWESNSSHSSYDSQAVVSVACMLLETSLYHRELVPIAPSCIARGALWLSQELLGGSPKRVDWTGMQQVLDESTAHVVQLLYSVLRTDNVSSIVRSKYSTAYKQVQRTLRPPPSTLRPRSSNSVFATPPARSRPAASSDAGMSPTPPALWLTPQTAHSTDEDDTGPLTPSVLSPLPTMTDMDDSMEEDGTLSPIGCSFQGSIKAGGVVPRSGPRIVVDTTHH